MKKLLIAMTVGALLAGCKNNAKPAKQNVKQRKAVAKRAAVIPAGQKPSMVLAGAALAKGTKIAAGTPCKIHVKVSGMVCQHGCAPQVRTALKGVKGISDALVSYKTKSAIVNGEGQVCAGPGTQKLIDKAFAKKQYKCKVSKIEVFAKAAKPAKAAKVAKPVKAKKGT